MKYIPFTLFSLIVATLMFSSAAEAKMGSQCTWEFSICLKVCDGPNCHRLCEARHCDPMSLDNLVCPVDDVVMVPSAASLAQLELRPLPSARPEKMALEAQDKALAGEQAWDEGNRIYLQGLSAASEVEVARGEDLMAKAQTLLHEARAEIKAVPPLLSPVVGSLAIAR